MSSHSCAKKMSFAKLTVKKACASWSISSALLPDIQYLFQIYIIKCWRETALLFQPYIHFEPL